MLKVSRDRKGGLPNLMEPLETANDINNQKGTDIRAMLTENQNKEQTTENEIKLSDNLELFCHGLSETEPTFAVIGETEIKIDLIIKQNQETSRVYDLTVLKKEIDQRPQDDDEPWKRFLTNRKNGLLLILYTTTKNGRENEIKAVKFYNLMVKFGLTSVYLWNCNFGVPRIDYTTTKTDLEKALKNEYSRLHSASKGLDEFENRLQLTRNEPPISTGYKHLDELLDGGLYPGLYTFGADTSLGKSTFWLNIALSISNQGRSVLFFSVEMSKYELTGRLLSKETYLLAQGKKGLCHAQTERSLTTYSKLENLDYNDQELVTQAKELFRHHARNLYLFENIGEIYPETIQKEVVNFMTRTGTTQPPVVIVDYIQILRSMDKFIDTNDKLKLDKALFFFKKLSNDMRVPVVLISSLNRDAYKNWSRITMTSFKESGSIEYTSDVLIGMQLERLARDGKMTPEQASEELSKDIREIDLVILKNRHGKRDVHTHFNYHTWFNDFVEVQGFDRYPSKTDTSSYSAHKPPIDDDDEDLLE